jgi:hypothetical protein
MAGITAHGIAIKARVDMLPVQHLLLRARAILPGSTCYRANMASIGYLFYNRTGEKRCVALVFL